MRLAFVLSLTLAVAATALPASAQQGNGSCAALLIGNSNYMWGGEPPLKEPVNDARSLGEELKRAGFDVDVRENLTKEAMQRAIDGFYGKLRTGMTGLIFFSGYGIQANRQSYLIPVDVDIFNESEVRPNGISLDNVLAEMNRRGAGVKIAIIDAARRFNPFENRFRRPGAGLAPVSSPGGTLVMYSATAGTPGGLVRRQQCRAGLVCRRVAQGNPRAGRVRRGGFQPHPHGRVAGLLERPESMDIVLAEPGILVLELQQAFRSWRWIAIVTVIAIATVIVRRAVKPPSASAAGDVPGGQCAGAETDRDSPER